MKIFKSTLMALLLLSFVPSGYASDAFKMCNASVKKIQFLINTLDKESLSKYKALLESSTTIAEISVLLQLDQSALESMVPEFMKEKNTTKQEAEERLVWGLKYMEIKNVDNAINFYGYKNDAGFWQQFLTACMEANISQ